MREEETIFLLQGRKPFLFEKKAKKTFSFRAAVGTLPSPSQGQSFKHLTTCRNKNK
jgi:hypothetical protein